MARNEISAIAREVYATFSDSDRDFTPEEVKLALRSALEPHAPDAFAALVDREYDKAESAEKKKADSRQGRLFEVSGVLVLGEDRRRGLKYATKRHYIEALAVKKVNRDRVVEKYEADEDWLQKLEPYWPEGVPYVQAVSAYRAAHPEDEEVAA